MKFDIVLLYPPIAPGTKPMYTLPPLGLLYIGSFLKANNISVKIIDAEKDGLSIKDTVTNVLAYDPDFVGISTMSIAYAASLAIARAIKRLNGRIKIILGGPHISATTSEALDISEDVDYLICGEGEHRLLELVRCVRGENPLEGISGLISKDSKNNIRINPPGTRVFDLDALPFPDFELIDDFKPVDYRVLYANVKHVGVIVTSRGCPYKCSYCAAHQVHGFKTRFRSVENVLSEIQLQCKKYNTKYIVIKDSTFTINRNWTTAFCQGLLGRKIKIRWSCNTRVDKIDADLLQLMRSAGCTIISYGVESGSEKILQSLQKNITVADVRRAFRLTRKAGIGATAAFMIGNPGEDETTIRETMNLAREIEPHFVKFYIATALPGTKLYDNAIRYGLIDNPKWYLNNNLDMPNSSNTSGALSLPGVDMAGKLRECYRTFYFRPDFCRSVIKRCFADPYFIRHVARSLISTYDKWRKK